MKAATRKRYGLPDVIRVEHIDVPLPAHHELLVRVHAATVSRTDYALLTARPFFMRFLTGLRKPRTTTLGTDFTGRVEARGNGVTEFEVGDRVWGMNDLGASSHAEYLVISTKDSVVRMPSGSSYTDAAACIEGAWYAYSVIERVALKRNQRVLINGATGAIGSALLQLSVHRGARVTAVGNTKNLSLLKSLGAERIIDFENEDFTQDDQVYDYVFDAVGKSTFGASRHLLTPKGAYVSTELGPGWQNPVLALLTPALGRQRVVFPVPLDRKEFFEVMRDLIAAKHFRPIIDCTFALSEIREAYSYVATGQKTGSVVLKLIV